jgi:hypothetical protein
MTLRHWNFLMAHQGRKRLCAINRKRLKVKALAQRAAPLACSDGAPMAQATAFPFRRFQRHWRSRLP